MGGGKGFSSLDCPEKWRKSNGKKGKKNVGKIRSAILKVIKKQPERLMVDSGTSAHITSHSDRLFSTTKFSVEVTLAYDSTITADSKGKRSRHLSNENGIQQVKLSDTLHVPNFTGSLLSVT